MNLWSEEIVKLRQFCNFWLQELVVRVGGTINCCNVWCYAAQKYLPVSQNYLSESQVVSNLMAAIFALYINSIGIHELSMRSTTLIPALAILTNKKFRIKWVLLI